MNLNKNGIFINIPFSELKVSDSIFKKFIYRVSQETPSVIIVIILMSPELSSRISRNK